jgi:hypothetical protein
MDGWTDMFSWAISVFTGGIAIMMSILLFIDDSYVQGRFIGFTAVMFGTSAAFRALALIERETDKP